MDKYLKSLVAAAACAAVGVAAYAAVTFDAETGTGFVGKGDVQLAFGWNNAQLQENGADVIFTYLEVGKYTVVCTGHSNPSQNPKTFENKEISIDSEILVDTRRNSQGQVTGFLLLGLGDEEVTGEGCPTAWPTEVSRTPNEDAGVIIGIYATHGDESVLIWTPEDEE